MKKYRNVRDKEMIAVKYSEDMYAVLKHDVFIMNLPDYILEQS